MAKKKSLQDFLSFLNQIKQQRINFFLAFFIFLFLPGPLIYPDNKLSAGRPVIRSLNIDLPQISAYPVNVTGVAVPNLSSSSVLVIDAQTKTIIYSKAPDLQLKPASTTKIMTALVSLDYYPLNKVLTVKNDYYPGQTMKLVKGEQMTVENLLYGLLVLSGNDAGYTLAENYSGGLDNFVQAMNQKAKKFHLEKTSFTNPVGLDEKNHFTTTHDLAILTSEAMKNPVFERLVDTKTITVADISGEKKHVLKNINELLGEVQGLKGVKTGWTEEAGECLVSYTERNDEKIITVVLGSLDRFGDTKKLIEWVFANFKWEPISATGQ